jgi:hypothetical protein
VSPTPLAEASRVETSSTATSSAASPASAVDAAPVAAALSDTTSGTGSLRLAEADERVLAAVNDVQVLSRQPFFVSKDGDELVFQGHLNTPESDVYQTSFNVGDLDLSRAVYPAGNSNLNVPCKAGAKCASYAVFDASAEEAGGRPKDRRPYGSINIWSGSPEDAQRIVQDLQQLQGLQR